MTRARDAMARLQAADPVASAPDVVATEWAREVLDRAMAAPGDAPAPRRRRWPRRRGLAVAVAGLVVAGGGAAVAGIAFDQDAPAPAPIERSLRAALDLPGPDRASLQPLPGGIRQKLVADTPFGRWGIMEIQTSGRGPLLSYGPLSEDGMSLTGSNAIGGCPVLGGRVQVNVCGGGSTGPPAAGRPAQHVVGRVGADVAAVEVRAPGVVERGWVGAGVFLVLLEHTPGAGSVEIAALDEAGSEVGRQTLAVRSRPDEMPMLLPIEGG